MADLRTNGTGSGIKPALVAAVLAIFAVTGLSAGITVGAALGGAGMRFSGETQVTKSAGPATSPAPLASSAPTIPPYSGNFSLAISFAPNPASAGEHLAVKVNASGADGASPAAGVRCTIEDTTGTSLLPATIAPVITDASGQASWDVVVPAGAIGPHTLKVTGVGAQRYSYYVLTTVTVAG